MQQGINIGVMVTCFNRFSVTFKVTTGSKEWTCTVVYASPIPSCRAPFWHYLGDLSSNIHCPWLMLGDFNEILLPGDQRGGVFLHSRAEAFARMMEQCGMVDLNTVGGRFTWHRNCKGNRTISKKLDRALANIQWRMFFAEAFVEELCRFHSDHNPLLIRLGRLPQNKGTRPFWFEAAWITHEKYHMVVEEAWNVKRGRPSEALAKVKEDSIIFNHEVFGNVLRRKKVIEARLKGIQCTLERVDSRALVHLEYDLQHEYNRILLQEEMLWYHKSRENWVKFGNKNTAFFHTQTVIRRKRNKIHGLTLPDGTWSTDDSILRMEAQNYFQALFCSTNPPYTHFQVARVPRLDEDGVK